MLHYGYGDEFFNNSGTVRKSAGSASTLIYIQFNNAGTVEVDAATISFQGGFSPGAGELRFGFKSLSGFGTISFPGSATLGGTVGAVLLGGYVPATNNSFTVLTYGSHSGMITGLDLPAAVLWATNYTSTSFTLTVASMNKLAFTAQPVGGVLTNTITAPVVVQIEHPVGEPVAAAGVPITVALASGGGAVHGTLTQNTDISGKATFGDLSFDQFGIKTLLATAPNLTSVTSAPFAILPLIGLQLTSGGAKLQLNGNNNLGPVVIYASTNLTFWTPIDTNPPASGPIIFVDSASTNLPARFYRAVEQ